jgi:hypothetical protein
VAAFAANASGTNSFAVFGTASNNDSYCIGRTGVASGARSFVVGYGSSAGAADSYAFGLNGSMDRANALAFGSGRFAANGDSQSVLAHRRIVTTSTTVGSMTFSVPSGKVISFFANIIAVKSDGSAVSQYVRKFCIKNVAGTTSMVGTVETIGTDYENNPATDVAITADDTTDSLKIDVTGVISETWRWLVALDGAEIAYGT